MTTVKHYMQATVDTIPQPTLRRSVGRGHYHQSVAKEVSEEAAQNHGISNVSYLGWVGGVERG